MNDDLYQGVEVPTLASVGKSEKDRDLDTKIFSDLALHLNTVQFGFRIIKNHSIW